MFLCLSVHSSLLHLVTLFCNTVLPSGRFSPTLFSRLQAVFLRRSITADLDFTRASWATTVILSTITLFLITSRIECVTTFAQAFQRSDQTAQCALHRTFRVADDQLHAFIDERFEQRCDSEKLRVLSSLKTCVFLLICKPLAS